MSEWREEAAPIIARVLKETAGKDEKAIKKALRDAYPFGQRAYHPYKIWCNEVRRQRGFVTMTKKRRDQLAQIAVMNPPLLFEETPLDN